MKQVFSFLMIVLALQIGFQQGIIVMHFKLNQDAIEKKFCINKYQPELLCHGTCHLKKLLKETESENFSSISIYLKMEMLPISILELTGDSPTLEAKGRIHIYQNILYTEPYLEIPTPHPIL